MRTAIEFTVLLTNKPGVLAGVTEALARQRVNMVALALSDSGSQGALRLVCDDPQAARDVLGKVHDRWDEAPVLLIELDNRAGAFAAVTRQLAENHVNVSHAYCTGGASGGRVTAVIATLELKKAQKILTTGEPKPPHGKGVQKTPHGRKSRA